MLGFSKRSNGKVRCDAINNPATGRDREPVRQLKAALGRTCPTCGSETPKGIGTIRRPVGRCDDTFHTVQR
jgi:hypothetical protein